ncbi:MAG TPA: FAD-dependent oxidoreductase [Limnochordales bacterium]|nr:FAD-dependent oxidoreductase [Limnochordales bacterium]
MLVLGGSFAGLEAARTARRLLGPRARITVIDRTDTFVFRPSLPWVAFGQRRPEQICAPLPRILSAHGIQFVQDHVEGLEPERSTVHGRAGRYRYDYLVIALGASTPPQLPPGWAGRCHVPLWLAETVALRQAVARFPGGPVVVALHPPSPLTCPAYEFVFQAAAWWRRRGLGHRCRLTFITYEEDPCAVGGSRAVRAARRWMDQAGIRLITGTFIERVTPTGVVLGDGYELPAALIIGLPPYQGSGFLRQVPYLTDAEGFVVTDPAMRSRAYVNIFAAGDCVALPGPKTGLMAEQQGRVAAANIAADLGLAAPVRYRSLFACLVDLGPGRGLLSVRQPAPQLGRVQTRLFLTGSLPRWGKHALEHYFLRWRLRVPAGRDQPEAAVSAASGTAPAAARHPQR